MVFGDIFDWAGVVRTIPIFKTTGFCAPQYIETYAAGLFTDLASENHLRGMARAEFVSRLAHYFAEVNELHPFREGNGRAQRAFFGQLVAEAGFRVRWTFVDQAENLAAALAAHEGDLGRLEAMLDGAVTRGS